MSTLKQKALENLLKQKPSELKNHGIVIKQQTDGKFQASFIKNYKRVNYNLFGYGRTYSKCLESLVENIIKIPRPTPLLTYFSKHPQLELS